MGALHTIPINIGIFTGTNPHILKGVKTSSPLSFVDEFINSIPRLIFYFYSSVISIYLSSPLPSLLANSLKCYTVFTASKISSSFTKKFFGFVTPKKC